MEHNFQHRDAAVCARCNNPEWYLEISQVELDPQDRGLSRFKLPILSPCVLDLLALLFGDALRVTHYFFPFLLMYM